MAPRGQHMRKARLDSVVRRGRQPGLEKGFKENLNASRPSEHPPVRGGNVETFRREAAEPRKGVPASGCN